MRPITIKLCEIFFLLFLIVSLFFLSVRGGLSQPVPQEDKGPQIELGGVTFRSREIESKPELVRMLELHIQILNRSRKFAAPPNSITVAAVPKEIKSSEEKAVKDFDPGPVEATLNVLLPPRTGRVLIIGVPLPREKIASMTLEVQINPPEGEKKTVTWTGE